MANEFDDRADHRAEPPIRLALGDTSQLRPEGGDRRPLELKIANQTLELSIKDPQFDQKLLEAARTRGNQFDHLKLTDFDPGVKVNYWQDPKGLFIYFTDSNGQNRKDAPPPKRHYLPDNVAVLNLPNENAMVEKLRIDVNKAYADSRFKGMQDFGPNFNPQRDGGYNAMSYYTRMSNIGSTTLDAQERMLRQAVKDSDNPYYKIYLSDTLTAQAMQPITDALIHHGTVNVRNPETLRKLDEAMRVLDGVNTDSRDRLNELHRSPKGYSYNPLAPGRPYWDSRQYPDDYYGFWGGSYDQAMARQAALKLIYGMINTSNAIPRFELPPNLPPR